MIPGQFALILALQNLVFVIVAGGALGLAASASLRQSWSWRVLMMDMCTAGAATFLIVLVTVFFNLWQYTTHDRTRIIEIVGISAPAVRHVAGVALHRQR